MPTYEYLCPKCGRFDFMQKITADALKHCPTCDEQVQRLISNNVNFILKGSGFYSTDNRPIEKGTGNQPAEKAPDNQPTVKKDDPKAS